MPPRNGFTLVELMIALAVMALLTSAVVLTVGSGGNEPRDSAERLAGRIAAARDQAVLTARPVSLWVRPSGYGFADYRDGRWQPLDEKPFRQVDWARGVALAGEGAEQRLRFNPLGLPDRSAQLALASGGRTAAVRVTAAGEVSVQ